MTRDECIQRLSAAATPEAQLALREPLRGESYYFDLIQIYLINPFLRLTEAEIAHYRQDEGLAAWWRMIEPRVMASRSTAPKYSVFCMPKSGSSFVQSALQHALQLPSMSMTGFGSGQMNSYFGMNAREQEIDEQALIKAITVYPGGFTSQNHTRCSAYLTLQMKLFTVTPILTVRNVLDCLVSFDDMMMAGRRGKTEKIWINETQFALPYHYDAMADADRLDLLARSFGVWLIAFYLSWRRCMATDLISPVVLRYEDAILDKSRFVEALTTGLSLSPAQAERLARYADDPDRARSRFNKGVSGRGREAVPETAQAFLEDHARLFLGELTEDDIRYLVR